MKSGVDPAATPRGPLVPGGNPEHLWLFRFKRRIIAGLVLLLLVATLLSMFAITLATRDYLLKSSAVAASELAESLNASLKYLMVRRSPDEIQNTITQLGRNGHIAGLSILDRDGRVVYAADRTLAGKRFALTDESCRTCHSTTGAPPTSTTTIFRGRDGINVQRNVTVIHNDPECYGCHAPEHRINGKLIIDCSLAATYDLIATIRLVILASSGLCLLIIFLAIPYLSRAIDRYIDQVVFKSNEITMIYAIIECVSKSIDVEDLKTITLDIVASTFASEEVTIVLPLRDGHYRVISRGGGHAGQHRVQEPGVMLASAIGRWQAGTLSGKEVSADRTVVYLPIVKGELLLALIEVRSSRIPFSDDKLRFMDAVINPIAIAFENARLYSIAITDDLTGLYTVRHFRTCLDRRRDLYERQKEKFALLIIDLDDFKSVNDTYGHPVGDAVLKRVSWAITEALREHDLPFRYGGEEFAVLLPVTGENSALLVAERIRAMVAGAVTEADGRTITRTVSVGLAIYPDHAATVRDLVVAADNALYVAKRGGKNRIAVSGEEAVPTA
jgi:diguanylate cyclase (GGDEF)-like protein